MSLGLAFRCFFKTLTDQAFKQEVSELMSPPQIAEDKPNGQAVQLLGFLQRDGRLVDFLQEEIAGYSDEEVGAAVRDIHRDCKEVLERYLALEPVLAASEDETMEVPEGFDPNEIRLTGNVKGAPPMKGTVAHRGWRVSQIKLPEIPQGSDPLVLAPGEVEIE